MWRDLVASTIRGCRGRYRRPLPGKSSADDAFHDQVIRRASSANAHAEVNFPLRRYIYIDRREKLLLLVAQRIKIPTRPESAIVFQAATHHFGVAASARLKKIVAGFEIRRELHSAARIFPMQRRIERRIERQIPT